MGTVQSVTCSLCHNANTHHAQYVPERDPVLTLILCTKNLLLWCCCNPTPYPVRKELSSVTYVRLWHKGRGTQPASDISDPVAYRIRYAKGAGIACWLECQTCDRKVASSNPCRRGWRIFFSRVNFVCWLSFGVRSTPVLLQWHVKDPGHSAKSVGDRLHLNTRTPLTHQSQSGLTMPLSRQSVGIYQEMSSKAIHQGILGHSHLSSLSCCGLILA